MSDQSEQFYTNLTPLTQFGSLGDPGCFRSVPEDWVIGTSDIVDSTNEIARGRYKTVNMVGAAVVSAMTNALEHRPFPYVFGGDGASFAVPGEYAETARKILATLRRWADEEFSIGLRAALVPLADIRASGRDVRVARYAPSEGVDYAMFAGRGLAWAEARMKAGDYMVEPASPGAQPDLTGLSCRWSNAKSENGRILSLVVVPSAKATEPEFAEVTRRVVEISDKLARGGHPLPVGGPGIKWPPPGLDIDAHISRSGRNLVLQKALLVLQNLMIWVLFRANITLGSFDPTHYAHMVSSNADFRKLDDGLKMTLDCDAQTQSKIEQILDDAKDKGVIRYGLFAQDEAMVTCFVPSAMRDDHVHFIDGAAGGYARAAAAMKT